MKLVLVKLLIGAVCTQFIISGTLHAVELKGRAVAIYVDDMHCKNCAKKIARKLYTVPGVLAVHADVKQNVALITPQKGKDPSRRALWEAVESAKFQPVKMIGPDQTYKTKPAK